MFSLVERDYYRGHYCCIKDTLIGIPPGIHQETGRGSTDRLRRTFSPFTWDDTAWGSGGFTRDSSSEPILSAVDPSLYLTAIYGEFVQTTAHPRIGTAMHRQDTPRGSSRTVRQTHLAPRVDRSAYKLFPVGKMSFHSIMQSLSQILKLEGVQVHSNRTNRSLAIHVLF